MRDYPKSVIEFKIEIANKVYKAAVGLFEGAEDHKLIRGNGHHLAQEIAQRAVDLFTSRLIIPEPEKESAREHLERLRNGKS